MKRLLTAISAILMTSPMAVASTTLEDHQALWRELQSVGVTIRVNDPKHCQGLGGGSYHSAYRTLSICQDNATQPNQQVQWTLNDLDTLRHEAHHVIQDCADGRAFDGQLVPYHDTKEDYTSFVNRMPGAKIKAVMNNYINDLGVSDDVVILELEAFSAADSVSARNIAAAVRSACGA